MDKILGQDYQGSRERVSFLKDNCDAVEERGYMKPFTPDTVTAMKNELAEVSIQINDIQAEKKEAMKDFKLRTDPLTDEKKILLGNIKQKAEFVKEQCYKFIDRTDKMTGFYNADGLLVECRPSTPDELQATIFQDLRKTGTND
jgi:hypothetical protein